MKKPKSYKIKIPKAMLDCITEDNLENFIEGLEDTLRFYVKVVGIAKTISGNMAIGRKNTELVRPLKYTYIGDGKQENYAILKGKP
ncbi:MAG: hypothetical protein M0P47_09395 [Bacteroidales bacterium]|nr:hypothetical protein [Bacteroidales bacterium]